MRMRLAVPLAAASIALSACADQAPSPTSPAAIRPSFALSGYSTVCNPRALKALVGDYALKSKDDLATIVGAMQTEFNKNGKGFKLTNLAFDGLARLAVMRGDATLQRSDAAAKAAFDGLVKGFVACTEDYIVNSVGQRQDDFSSALGSGWMFEVRTVGTGAPADGAVYEKSTGNPYWSANAAWNTALSVAATSPTVATNRVLVYGYHFDENAYPYVILDDKVDLTTFEIRTIPAQPALVFSPTSKLTIGMCNLDAINADVFGKYRAEHKADLLKAVAPTCGRAGTFTPVAANTGLTIENTFAMVGRAIDFFAPQPAYAASMFFVGSIGGAVSELSPSVIVDLKSANLTFVSQPIDGYINTVLTGNPAPYVRVKMTSLAGTPLSGVLVTIKVANNSGSFVAASGATATTDASGIATFDALTVNKAGGYLLNASATFDGNLPGSAISNLFNVKNKAAP